jgi:hypothetical protein
MIDLLEFVHEPDPPIPTNSDIPKELEIYYRSEQSFLPAGKTFSDLTPEELNLLRERYRFSQLTPGLYQGITYIGDNTPS